MKKIKLFLPILIALSMLTCFQASANTFSGPMTIPTKEEIKNMTKEEKEALGEQLKARTDEIKAMDKSNMSRAERKALKKELRSMHKAAAAVTGVYISVGALIIIILLLIIIL